MTLDAQANSYVAGNFEGSLTFGSTTLTATGTNTDGFIAKYDPDRSPVWATRLGDGVWVDTWQVVTDAGGNVYVAGGFEYTATFGTFTLTNASGQGAAFLAKLDPSGHIGWVRQFGGAQAARGYGVAVDASGNVYTSGYFDGAASFGSGVTLTSSDSQDAFVAKLDSAGNTLWAQRMGGENLGSNGNDSVAGMATDPAGNVYLAGWFAGTGLFGSTLLTSKGTRDAFVARLDPSGNFQWAQRMGGEGVNQFAFNVTVDSRSADPSTWAIYAGGEVAGNNVDFGATTFAAPNGDPYVAKLDATTGSFTWADHFSGTAESRACAVALDGAGNVYATGTFTGTTDFDPGAGALSLTSSTGSTFVSKLDPNGNFLAAWQTVGSTGGYGLAADAAGDVWVSGTISATTTFPTGQTSSPNSGISGQPFTMRMNAPNAVILGSIYNDLNSNGARDAGEPALTAWTAYADLNNNGIRDAGEPSTTSDGSGNYQIGGLAPGTYTVRVVLPSGWTATAGSFATVTVGEGTTPNVNLGAFAPTTTRTYSNQSAVKTTRNKPNAVSTLTVSDVKTIYDLHLTLNVSNTLNQSLTVTLRGPDGTSVTLVANTTSNGTVTYETPAFNSKMLKGTWTLEVDGLSGGTLNSWSLSILEST
jgi:subtilisin-like proprotein convertase family protein